ncbi:Heat shock protein 33 [Aggregatibacter aphrophilus]|uniref:33 kDa chaperonin n=2 Tax=Aggregatibacter aphrophilus TaxID=732 RepID=A0A336N8U2_AGGAP|nr:Heat shock protein 33 [Aggregatibacter aphrophilus]
MVILALSAQRRSAPEAQLLYRETEQSLTNREKLAMARKMNALSMPHPDRRPDKKNVAIYSNLNINSKINRTPCNGRKRPYIERTVFIRNNTMTNYTQDNDQLYRYLFKDRAVRGEWVRLNQTFNDTLNTHHYPQAVRNLLGEMMVATSLLTATLKFNGNITVQIQGDGPLKLALVNGDDQQRLRALARLQGDIQDGMSLHEMIGKGVLVITIAPQEGERYQGVVPLDKPTITECLEDYFIRSEQLQTQLIIRTGEYQGQPVAAGMLLQIVPDGSGSPEDFEHLATLTATIKDEEIFGLTAEELLYRLYHEEIVELFPAQAVHFYCGCSQDRSGAALLLISDEEIEQILAEHNGSIDMQCERCGTHYFFNKEAIEKLKQSKE